MLNPWEEIILTSGESLTAREVAEGFLRLAQAEAAFPILSRDDLLKACLELLFQIVQLNDEGGRYEL